MTTPPNVDLALSHLERFRRRALPSALRHLSMWKGLSTGGHADLVEDLEQELALDCIEHATRINELPTHERHARWFRLVHDRHYRLVVRANRRAHPIPSLDLLPQKAPDPAADPVELGAKERALAARVTECAVHHRNGRFHLRESAEQIGMRPRALRRLWCSLAERLGHGPEYRAFWQSRLVEALLGVAATVLDRAGALRTFERDHRSELDRRRLRRIRAALSVCPQPRTVRSAIARFTGKGAPTALDAVDPRRAVAAAASLSPLHPAVLLWQFEVAVAYAEWTTAARSLRRARRCAAPAVAVSLARARLSEARGRTPAAQRILVRALARHRDPRLAASLASLRHGHGHGNS